MQIKSGSINTTMIYRWALAAVMTMAFAPQRLVACQFPDESETAASDDVFLDGNFGHERSGNGFAKDELDDAAADDELLFKYKPNPDRIRLRSQFNPNVIARFERGEPIVIRVPTGSAQVVSSIVMEQPESFKSKPVQIRPRTRVDRRDVIVEISRPLLDRLDYQPVELLVYQSNVDRFILVPANEENAQAATLERVAITADFFVRLKPENGVAVELRPTKRFRLVNDVLNVQIPFAEIAAIVFDPEESNTAHLIMRNGDQISGRHDWPNQITFQTQWGNEEIARDEIVSLTRERSATIVPSGVANPRWIMISSAVLRQSNQP